MTVAAVVTAAGSGSRLGRDLPKALVPVGGTPMVAWATSAAAVVASRIVVTAPGEYLDAFRAAVAHIPAQVDVIPGGADRQSSVAAGVALLCADAVVPEVILVHDAARPFAPAAVFGRALAALDAGDADGVVPVVPVVDTVVAQGEGVTYLDRAALGAVQTPQVFRGKVLADVHRRAAADAVTATDDGSLLAHYGYRVATCEGSLESRKVTFSEDLEFFERRMS